MNIRDVMTPNPRTVSPGDSIQSAAAIMRDEDTGVVPIVDNGRAVGVVTDRDIVVRAVADGNQLNQTVGQIATNAVVCASPDMSKSSPITSSVTSAARGCFPASARTSKSQAIAVRPICSK